MTWRLGQGDMESCKKCGGFGFTEHHEYKHGRPPEVTRTTCSECEGSGWK